MSYYEKLNFSTSCSWNSKMKILTSIRMASLTFKKRNQRTVKAAASNCFRLEIWLQVPNWFGGLGGFWTVWGSDRCVKGKSDVVVHVKYFTVLFLVGNHVSNTLKNYVNTGTEEIHSQNRLNLLFVVLNSVQLVRGSLNHSKITSNSASLFLIIALKVKNYCTV